jgi:hypothetical protein
MQEEGVLVVVLEVRREEMPRIGLVGVRRELLEGIGLGVMRVRVGTVRVELRREGRAETGLREETRVGRNLGGMREGGDHQPITLGLRGILMRDFRREAIGHRLNRGRSHSHNNGLNRSLSNGLSRDHSRRGDDRVVSAGITTPERHGPRAIVGDPVRVAVVDSEEVGSDEIA